MSARTVVGRTLAALALAFAVTACDESDPITGPTPVASVTVAIGAATLPPGQTTTATATALDASGQPLAGRTMAWTSNDPAIATVTSAGQVTAIAPGVTRIRATSEGKIGYADLTVLPRTSLVASVTLDVSSVVLERGQTRQLTATPRDVQGDPVSGVDIAWAVTGSNAAVTVSAAGLVTAREMGMVTVTARVGDHSAQATVTVLGDATHDLVFERWGTDAGGIERPWLHRLDLRMPGAEPVRIFEHAGTFSAAPSPDGSKLAFVCITGHSTAICVANRDGSGVVMLPGFGELNGLRANQPAWSPDGSRIAFRGWAPGGDPGIFNPADIWVMNADGSNKVKLTAGQKNEDSYERPTWSPLQPDGSYRIAFARVTRGDDGFMRANIQSVRADGQDRRVVTAPGGYVDSEPTWSPDGATIAFVRTGGTVAGDIWLVSASGGNERALMAAASEPSAAQRAPAWSPDGGLIAFASNHEIIANYYAWQIYTVRADGTDIVRRTSDAAEKGSPAWMRRP